MGFIIHRISMIQYYFARINSGKAKDSSVVVLSLRDYRVTTDYSFFIKT